MASWSSATTVKQAMVLINWLNGISDIVLHLWDVLLIFFLVPLILTLQIKQSLQCTACMSWGQNYMHGRLFSSWLASWLSSLNVCFFFQPIYIWVQFYGSSGSNRGTNKHPYLEMYWNLYYLKLDQLKYGTVLFGNNLSVERIMHAANSTRWPTQLISLIEN